MDEKKCPGQDLRKWKPEDIKDVTCPSCGKVLEIWKDESVRLCKGCGREIRNPLFSDNNKPSSLDKK